MAYPKININTLTGVNVANSDTLNIPLTSSRVASGIATITGTTLTDISIAAVGANGTFDSIVSAERPVDSSAKFLSGGPGGTPSYYPPVVAKNFILNTTDNTSTSIDSVVDETTIQTKASIFVVGEAYTIYNQGFVQRYQVKIGDIIVNETTNSIAEIDDIIDDCQLQVPAAFAVSTNVYTVYSQDAADLGTSSHDGFLIYVGSSTAITQDIQPTDPVAPGVGVADPRYVDIRVLTVNNQDIIFKNFKVGEYLPVQCKRVFATNTTAGVQCIAMS